MVVVTSRKHKMSNLPLEVMKVRGKRVRMKVMMMQTLIHPHSSVMVVKRQ